jgi:abnormal spindle-like microcephaly-associated protein
MRELILSRLMTLVFFLDQAKEQNILDRTTRLFRVEAKVKSTKQMLAAICRDFLAGEGDIIKHFSRVGLTATYKQTPIDELDFAVHNLATDLRDGACLARAIEILSNRPPTTIVSTLRLPAVSRLQKIHNIGKVLEELRSMEVPLISDLAAHHVVDGHRPTVIQLMWSIVSHLCLENVVPLHRLRTEIQRIKRTQSSLPKETIDTQFSFVEKKDAQNLVLEWCQVIAIKFGLTVRNWDADFSDGRLLCLLVHYYHPDLLSRSEIKLTVAELPLAANKTLVQRALINERRNMQLASSKMKEIGGIPHIVPLADSNHPVDEKSMQLCLSFMCARLIESGAELRSTIIVQRAYRAFHAKRLLLAKKQASRVIWSAWEQHQLNYFANQRRFYRPAVRIIESFVCTKKWNIHQLKVARLLRTQHRDAAIKIQVRAYSILSQLYIICPSLVR